MRYARENPDWDPDDGLPIAVFPPVVRPQPDPDDGRPAPADRCAHCGGWGAFEDVLTDDAGRDVDSDLECGACDGTGIAS